MASVELYPPALLPLAGAGLAALLSVELVVTNAVLGNQVAPAEMVHAVFICREKQVRHIFSSNSNKCYVHTTGDKVTKRQSATSRVAGEVLVKHSLTQLCC